MTMPYFPMPGHDRDELLFLSRDDVLEACADIDVVALVADALRAHASDATLLPDEAYLSWQAPDGADARSLAMHGGLANDEGWVLGVKVINGCLSNPSRGIARAQGVIMLFDQQTARLLVAMEAAYISAIRTAAVTAVTAKHLAVPRTHRLAVLGCGTQARAHMQLLTSRGKRSGSLPDLEVVALYDSNPAAAHALATDLQTWRSDLKVVVASDPRSCVSDAELVVTLTTATAGYIEKQWLTPGALVAHVSLDDLLPEVISGCDLLIVDDWKLVSQDSRRILGRMHHAGQLLGPDAPHKANPVQASRRVDASIGDILKGTHPGRASNEDIIVSNPFGMAVLDVVLADSVLRIARAKGAGQWVGI